MTEVLLSAGAGCLAGAGLVVGGAARAYNVPFRAYLRDILSKLSAPPPQVDKATVPAPQNKAWLPTEQWLARHEMYKQPDRNKCQLVFLGDSITEGWLGNGLSVWKARYEQYNAFNLGIGGDEVQHVLWRVQDGALSGLAPKVLVLMIGTNNIGNVGHKAGEVAMGVGELLHDLHKRLPKTKILLLGVFPRDEQPGTRLRKEISLLNSKLKQYPGHTYLDIGAAFLNDDKSISPSMMPDYLHLSTEAYAVWADSIEDTLKALMKS